MGVNLIFKIIPFVKQIIANIHYLYFFNRLLIIKQIIKIGFLSLLGCLKPFELIKLITPNQSHNEKGND